MHNRTPGFPLTLVLIAQVLSPRCPAQAPARSGSITQLRPTNVQTPIVVDGKPNAAIVCPADDALAELAGRLVQRINGLTGALLPVVSWEEVSQGEADRHLILLGNMANNRVAFDLYVQHQIACDLLYPGKGGFVLRTVHDPWATGRNVILLGGSEADGVATAVDAFLAGLRPGQSLTVPRLMQIQIAGLETMTAEVLRKEQEHWRNRFVKAKFLWYGATHDLRRIGELYLLTGKEDYAQLFAEMAERWIEEYRRWAPERQITTPKYAIPRLILTWDAIEESPAIPDDLKLDMANVLYDYVKRMARHARIRDWQPGHVRHTGHLVCLSVLYGARYFKKHYPLLPMAAIDQGLRDIDVGMATLAQTPAVLSEDGYWHFHPETIAHYAMATGDRTFFDNGMSAKMCEYAALCTTPLGGFHGHMSEAIYLADWVYRDARWKWLAKTLAKRGDNRPALRGGKLVYEPWTFPSEGPTKLPVELSGVTSFPLDPVVYQNIATRRGTTYVTHERAFRQAALRGGFGKNDQYVLLDGINTGLHKVGDGNALRCYFDRGDGVLVGGKWGSQEMKYQNAVLVRKNGRGSESQPLLCELMAQVDLRSFGFLQSRLPAYNGADWCRTLTWIKNELVIVTDTLEAREAGDYSFACQWRTVGDPQFDGRALTNKRGGKTFTIRAASSGAYLANDEGVKVLRNTKALPLAAGQTHTFCHLLYANPDASLPRAWRRWQSCPETVFRDRASPHNGKACLSIKTASSKGWQCLAQTVSVPPGAQQIVLSAFARTNGKVGARIHVTDAETRQVLTRIDFEGEDWQQKTVPLRLDPAVGPKLDVWAGTTSYKAEGGQVWLDSVSLKAEGEAAKELVRNPGFEKTEDAGRPAREYDLAPVRGRTDMALIEVEGEPMLSFAAGSSTKTQLRDDLTFEAAMCVIAPTRFAAANARSIVCGEKLMQSTAPVSVDLDLRTGKGVALCETDVTLSLPCGDGGPAILDGETVEVERSDGLAHLSLPPGRHVLDLPPVPADSELLAETRAALDALTQPASAVAEGKPAPVPEEPATVWKWQGAKGAVNALATGPLESEGLPHVAVASADGTLYMLSPEGKKVWHFSPGKPLNDVLIDDLDGDGEAEIVTCCDNYRVYCLSSEGNTKWELNNQKFEIRRRLPGEYGVSRYVPAEGEFIIARVVDLDGDGRKEVIAGSKTFQHGSHRVFGTLFAIAHDGKILWHTYQSGGNPTSLDIADADGNGRPEIALATGGPTYARSNYLLTAKGQLIHRYGNPYGPELIRFIRSDASRPPTLVSADERSGVVSAFDAVPPYSKKWAFPTGAFKIVGLEAVDIDGDGAEEAMVATLDGDVYAFSEGTPDRLLWRRTLNHPLSAACIVPGRAEAAPPAVAVGSIDGTLALVSHTSMSILGKTGNKVRCLSAHDINGDGVTEVLVGSENGHVWAVRQPAAAPAE